MTVSRFVPLPWGGGHCHPGAADAESATREWAQRQSLIPTHRHLAKLQRAQYAWQMARCHPYVDRETLQTLADFMTWFFTFDDAYFDRVSPEPQRAIGAISAVLGVLESGQVSRTPVFGEAALADLCRRLHGRASREQFERLAQGMRLYICSVAVQLLGHLDDHPVAIPSYETLRRYVSGVEVAHALIDISNPDALTDEEYYRPDVRSLSRRMNNIVSWLNDVHSLAVELYQPGYFWNMAMLCSLPSGSLSDGIMATLHRVREEIARFDQEAALIEPDASAALRQYVDGLRQWVCGYCEWVDQDSQRYSSVHAPRDGEEEKADETTLAISTQPHQPQK